MKLASLLAICASLIAAVICDVPGIEFHDKNSSSSKYFPFLWDEVQFCAFVALSPNESGPIISFEEEECGLRTLTLSLEKDVFLLEIKEKTVQQHLEFYASSLKKLSNEFFRICLIGSYTYQDLTLVMNSKTLDETLESLTRRKHKMTPEKTPTSNTNCRTRRVKVTLSSRLLRKISGMYLTSDNYILLQSSDKCTTSLNLNIFEEFQTWNTSGKHSFLNQTSSDLCKSIQQAFLSLTNDSYEGAEHSCKYLGGRLLLDEREASTFSNEILETAPSHCSLKNESISETFLFSTDKRHVNVYNFKTGQRRLEYSPPEIIRCAICLIPKPALLYLINENGARVVYEEILISGSGSTFQMASLTQNVTLSYDPPGAWNISFATDSQEFHTTWKFPLGRVRWNSGNLNSTFVLTTCERHEFPCSDGECVAKEDRCDNAVQCHDGTDEEGCVFYETSKRYRKSFLPSPPDNGIFTLRTTSSIYNIDDILASDAIAKMELGIKIKWTDANIEFLKTKNETIISCDKIWTPKLRFTERCFPSGHITPVESDYSCSIHFRKEISDSPTSSYSYKGQYVNGEEVEITYNFKVNLEIPCRFNHHLYPFGNQKCRFCYFIENEGEYLLTTEPHSKRIPYQGRRFLDEYKFLDYREDISQTKRVLVTIHLETLYGYHLFNSFIPSLLLTFISYSTTFFELEDSGGRVSVSITALLALMVLFTEASGAAVKTSYMKLLDIWYMTTIFISFLLVTFNSFLPKIGGKENFFRVKSRLRQRRNRVTDDEDDVEMQLLDSRKEILFKALRIKMKRPNSDEIYIHKSALCNKIVQFLLPLSFISFIFAFIFNMADD